jgi:putative endonuclease
VSARPTRKYENPRARHATGRAAEDLAAGYLERQGCHVLERRFACREGEIDLIVEDRGVVAFVEVKARYGYRFGGPLCSVTARKRRRIVATARAFLGRRRWRGRRCRFDVVGVRLRAGNARVEWVRDAFRA